MAAFFDAVDDDDQAANRVRPPPAEQSVEAEAKKDCRRQQGIDHGNAGFRDQDRVVQQGAGDPLALGQGHHGDDGADQPRDAKERRFRLSVSLKEVLLQFV